MERFLLRHEGRIAGSISGFDRMLFRGILRSIAFVEGMERFLGSEGVLLKDFGRYMQRLSEGIKQRARRIADEKQRPMQYLGSSRTSKEEIARQIAKRDGIQNGLICILSAVEPCSAFDVTKDAKRKRLRLVKRDRKCLHLYFYYWDPEFGLMHIRLQTWAPFHVQVCVNGREWLARQLDRKKMGYEKHDNCFTQIDDLAQAQQILNTLVERKWVKWLQQQVVAIHPYLEKQSQPRFYPYYWTLSQCEYATDVMFHQATMLETLYPALLRHAIEQFRTADVLRFLGRRIIPSRFQGEIRSHMGYRIDGVRIKHWVEENSIKMYDKAGSVLRIETTINNTKRFRVRRRVTRYGRKIMDWTTMRKGIVDIRRRVQLCQAANNRYLEALAVVGTPTPSHRILDPVIQPVTARGRRFRPLRPISPDDSSFFKEILSAQYLLQGVRNRDLRHALYPNDARDSLLCRRTSGRVTRRLQLFCMHGLLFRVPKTQYYRVTKKGHTVMNTALRFRSIDVALLAS
jgi:hypothetical protein